VNLGNVVRFWAHRHPDGVAVIVGDEQVTWPELDERTSRLANGLAELGVQQGDRIGILSANCMEYVELAIAGYKLGSILVPLNVRMTPPELRYIIEHAGCRAVVSSTELAKLAAAALDGSERSAEVLRIEIESEGPSEGGPTAGFGVPFDSLREADATDPDADVVTEDVAYICYTSGTTGAPKGAMLTHGSILAMSHHRILNDDLTSSSRIYLPFPLSFTGGIVTMWAPAYVVGSTFVLDTVMEPERAMQTIERYRITCFNAVPVIWQMILQHPKFADYDLSSLEICGSGGASVPESLLRGLQAAGLPMSQGYGLTEGTGVSAWLPAHDAVRKIGSCGRPMMHTRMRTVDPDEAQLVDVPPGEVGELIIMGPDVMLGYWNNPEATALALVDGWLRTGDLARIDDEGYVYIVDRSKDMLISGGLNVYPAEIEAVLSAIPGVAECAVIGVPDDRWGETALALIGSVPGASLDGQEILDVCRTQLADYKLPRYVVFRDEPLPRGMSGKVLKRELRDQYADRAALGSALR
jgi:fatty-acyl-CoA synthase